MTPLVSIAIPYHDTPETARFLSRLLKSIHEQTYKNIEIVLMKEGRMGQTYNACIKKAKGDIIKLMGMDDYFYEPVSVEKIVIAFNKPEVYWLGTGCVHDTDGDLHDPHKPEWNDRLYKGYNTLGGFAVISMRNKDIPEIDETLDWTVDVDWYWRIYQKHGLPYVIDDMVVAVGIGEHQTTNKLPMEQKRKEWELTSRKYE